MSEKDLHPQNGIRLLLEREEVVDSGATYRGSIYTADCAYYYRVELAVGGAATLTPEGEGAGGTEKALVNLARSIARAAERRAKDGLVAWPPRILRWRDSVGKPSASG